MPIVKIDKAIKSGETFEVPFPLPRDDVMDGKKDMAILIKGVGGHTGASDVTMSVSVFADIDPQSNLDDDGSVVDTESWTNITPAAYRLDTNELVDAPSVDFVGTTASVAWLDLDDLNADQLKFVVSFDAAPSGTDAQLIIKSRRDRL